MTAAMLALFSVLIPGKGWFGPDQPWEVAVKPQGPDPIVLVLTDFSGSSLDPAPDVQREFAGEGVADLRRLFPAITTPGTYILYAVPKPKPEVQAAPAPAPAARAGGAGGIGGTRELGAATFAGTPLVVSVREDRRRGAPTGPMVVKMEPLRYAIVSTDAGDMTVGFYYDVAPNTITNFIRLAEEGFYEGQIFHRVEPQFVIQGGDPRGDGTGGPGYNIDAEFSDRKHEYGVLSMARNTDPNESPNSPPRPEYANSAGSQFFIALDESLERKNTAQLDGMYTVFARIVGPGGYETLRKMSRVPLADAKTGRPAKPPVIKRIEMRTVNSRENPYRVLLLPPTTQPAGEAGR
jgi:peptidyl-prolyl cis-trans isomerase B (cyclophilin B)